MKKEVAYITFGLYLLLSASGLILLKSGSGNLVVNVANNVFNFSINLKMLLGGAFYILSFILFLFIIPKFNLSYIYPMSAGILFVIVLVASALFLGEKISIIQGIGALLILSGIVALNIK